MSKVQLSGNANGTGIFTIASPNSNTDRTIALPDAAGTIQVSGNPISGTTGTFTGLVDISAAGAGQIQFPATQNASANANTLDDYEEGTWSPSLLFSYNPASGATYTLRNGIYQKVGKWVTVNLIIVWSSKGTAGSAEGLGVSLPFQIASGNNYGAAAYTQNGMTLPGGVYDFGFQYTPGQAAVDVYTLISGSSKGGFTYSQTPSSGEIVLSLTYMATA